MVVSRELTQMILKGKSSFYKKNLHGSTFTSDPFSTSNLNKSSDCGVHVRNIEGVQATENAQQVKVVRLNTQNKIAKKNKKTYRKGLSMKFTTKVMDVHKPSNMHCNLVGKRVMKLRVAAQKVKRQ